MYGIPICLVMWSLFDPCLTPHSVMSTWKINHLFDWCMFMYLQSYPSVGNIPHYINGVVQDCGISIVNSLEILWYCTKPSIFQVIASHEGSVTPHCVQRLNQRNKDDIKALQYCALVQGNHHWLDCPHESPVMWKVLHCHHASCYPMATSHYLDQCWPTISKILMNIPEHIVFQEDGVQLSMASEHWKMKTY